MKKRIGMVAMAVLMLGLAFTGCGKENDKESDSQKKENATETVEATQEAATSNSANEQTNTGAQTNTEAEVSSETEAGAEDESLQELIDLIGTAEPEGETTRATSSEAVAGMAETVTNMKDTVASEIQTNGMVSEAELLQMVTDAKAGSVDPCLDQERVEMMSRIGTYLSTMGAEKAPEHALTKFGKAICEYVKLIVVDGKSYNSSEAYDQTVVIDSIADEALVDDNAIATQVSEFYQLVQ